MEAKGRLWAEGRPREVELHTLTIFLTHTHTCQEALSRLSTLERMGPSARGRHSDGEEDDVEEEEEEDSEGDTVLLEGGRKKRSGRGLVCVCVCVCVRA